MDYCPSDVVVRVLKNLRSRDLPQLNLVSREWHSILSDRTSLWRRLVVRHGEAKDESAPELLQLLRIFSEMSSGTVEEVRFPNTIYRSTPISPFLPLLSLSKSSLRKVDFPMGMDWSPLETRNNYRRIFNTFRYFPNLKHLNLGEDIYPGVVPLRDGNPFRLQLFAMDTRSDHEWEEEDLQWLSELESLNLEEADENSAYSQIHAIASVCSQSLTRMWLNTGYEHRPGKLLNLEKVRSLSLRSLRGDDCAWTGLNCPLLKEIEGNTSDLKDLPKPLNQVEGLKIQVLGLLPDFAVFPGQELYLEDIENWFELIRNFNSNLSRLQLLSDYAGGEHLYPIDILFLCLKVDLVLGAPCPKLSHFYIDPYQSYNPNTFAEVLLSRRLASKVVNVSWEGGKGEAISCADLTVYIDGDQIDRFRAAEERVLAKCSESVIELVGRAKILKLEEWEEDWYNV